MVKSKQVGLDEGSGEPCVGYPVELRVGYPVELRVGYLSGGTARRVSFQWNCEWNTCPPQ